MSGLCSGRGSGWGGRVQYYIYHGAVFWLRVRCRYLLRVMSSAVPVPVAPLPRQRGNVGWWCLWQARHRARMLLARCGVWGRRVWMPRTRVPWNAEICPLRVRYGETGSYDTLPLFVSLNVVPLGVGVVQVRWGRPLSSRLLTGSSGTAVWASPSSNCSALGSALGWRCYAALPGRWGA